MKGSIFAVANFDGALAELVECQAANPVLPV